MVRKTQGRRRVADDSAPSGAGRRLRQSIVRQPRSGWQGYFRLQGIPVRRLAGPQGRVARFHLPRPTEGRQTGRKVHTTRIHASSDDGKGCPRGEASTNATGAISLRDGGGDVQKRERQCHTGRNVDVACRVQSEVEKETNGSNIRIG